MILCSSSGINGFIQREAIPSTLMGHARSRSEKSRASNLTNPFCGKFVLPDGITVGVITLRPEAIGKVADELGEPAFMIMLPVNEKSESRVLEVMVVIPLLSPRPVSIEPTREVGLQGPPSLLVGAICCGICSATFD